MKQPTLMNKRHEKEILYMSHNSKTFKYSIYMIKCKPYIDSSIRSPLFYPTTEHLCAHSLLLLHWPEMVPEMEKHSVTEIRVRMDCNGCVHKIKKALHGITGIYDLYVDFPQQKITIIGWAEPEKIVKAIRKTRKSAIICSHIEQSDDQPPQETEPVPESGTAEAEGGELPPEQPQPEAAPPEGEKEPPLPPENPPPEEKPVPEPANEGSRSSQPPKPNEREEIHVIYHHPPDYGNRYAYDHYHQPAFGGGLPQPVHVTHSYNTYKASPYVTEYAYGHSTPAYTLYGRPSDQNSQVYYTGNNGNDSASGSANGNITSMFSEENPNACSIV